LHCGWEVPAEPRRRCRCGPTGGGTPRALGHTAGGKPGQRFGCRVAPGARYSRGPVPRRERFRFAGPGGGGRRGRSQLAAAGQRAARPRKGAGRGRAAGYQNPAGPPRQGGPKPRSFRGPPVTSRPATGGQIGVGPPGAGRPVRRLPPHRGGTAAAAPVAGMGGPGPPRSSPGSTPGKPPDLHMGRRAPAGGNPGGGLAAGAAHRKRSPVAVTATAPRLRQKRSARTASALQPGAVEYPGGHLVYGPTVSPPAARRKTTGTGPTVPKARMLGPPGHSGWPDHRPETRARGPSERRAVTGARP